MSKPITIKELKVLTNQVQLSQSIIDVINEELKLNAKTYAYIGCALSFLQLVGNHNDVIRASITKQVQLLYKEFAVSHDVATLFIRYNN